MNIKKTKIGVIGIRGYSVIYSGFETFVRKLIEYSSFNFYYYLFSRAGYGEESIVGKKFRNILINVPLGKYVETPMYSFFATLKSLSLPLDSVLYLSVANTPFLFLQKLRPRKIIVNVDGIDWRRDRWSIYGKLYLQLCERICVYFADEIITDSKSIYKYYKDKYRIKNLSYILYGAEIIKPKGNKTLLKFKLQKRKYILYIGRFVPENKVEDVLLAFKNIKTDLKCVIVGDSFNENNYKTELLNMAGNDKRIVFTGILRGKEYEEILGNSLIYLEPKTQGGIHPSLLEAMALGNCIVARNISEHKEALSGSGLYYGGKDRIKDLNKKIRHLIKHPKEIMRLGKFAQNRIKGHFGWKEVVEKYEKLFYRPLE